MTERQEKHYKETTPQETISRLQHLLKKIGIETEEQWLPVSTLGTYSLRVTVKDTEFGANGKGVTKEFATASAYAEFMERFQNELLDLNCTFSRNTHGFRHYADESVISAMELAKHENTFMKYFYQNIGLENASYLEKAKYLAKFCSIEPYYCHGESGFEMRPYYNVMTGKTEPLSYALISSCYASNGMCAGNSPEEALSQGLSEIFERYVQGKMMREKLSFPDVPEEVMKRWPYVYEMFCKAKAMDGYLVAMKDCSMGGKFPVAALLVCEKNTGRWGIKFGAHPDFGIAMERTMTEATQGTDLQKYCSNNTIDFANVYVDSEINIFNSFKCGTAFYPYQFLSEKSDFAPWNPPDISNKSNKEILASMIETVRQEGKEVYIRDVSYSGFPSLQVIVPGMSELCPVQTDRFKAFNTLLSVHRKLNAPETLTAAEVKKLALCLEYFSSSQYEFNLRFLFMCCRNTSVLPGDTAKGGSLGAYYLRAMCYIYLKDYANALRSTYIMYKAIENTDMQDLKNADYTQEDFHFWKGLLYYLSAMCEIQNHEQVMSYIRRIFDQPIADKIDTLFADPKQVFVKQYPSRQLPDAENPEGTDCAEFNTLMNCMDILKKLQLQNPISQEWLAELFA